MIKVKVQNIKTGKKYEAQFQTNALADQWVEKQTELKSWGESEADFILEREDITAEINAQKLIQKVRDEQARGRVLKEKLSSLVRQKLVSGSITIEQLGQFVELPAVKQVERYLDNGYLTLAKLAMQNGDFGNIISEEERATFIAEL